MPKYFVPLVATPPLDNGGGGGSDLPAVSAADNGDVLTVVNGVWDKAAPGGGGGGSSTLVVTYDCTDKDNVTANKTYAEVEAALSNANVVARVFFTEGEYSYYYPSSSDNSGIWFSYFEMGESAVYSKYIQHTSSGIAFFEMIYQSNS